MSFKKITDFLKPTSFSCVFCGKKIEEGKEWEIKLTSLRTRKESEIGKTYCHMKCFAGKAFKNFSFVRKNAKKAGEV